MKLKTTQMNLDPVKLRVRYERLRNDVDYKDITITSNDVTVSAHKCVLAASSEFFKILFQRAEMNKRHLNRSTFELGGFTAEEAKYLEPVIDFLYSGTLYMNDINFTGLVKMAEYLMIEELLELGERYINKFAAKENYLKLYLELKKSLYNTDGSKMSDMVSPRTSNLLKLVWEMVETHFYDHIIDSHEFFEELPVEVENLMLDKCQIGKVLKLALRWMKVWPLGYTFADSLINISYEKVDEIVDDSEMTEEMDIVVAKTALSVKEQVQHRTIPKSNKVNMLMKLDEILIMFGENLGDKKTEKTDEEKVEVNQEKPNAPLEGQEGTAASETVDKSAVTVNVDARLDQVHVAVTPVSVAPVFDNVNASGYIGTDGVLDLSAKDTSRAMFLSMPKVEEVTQPALVGDIPTNSMEDKETRTGVTETVTDISKDIDVEATTQQLVAAENTKTIHDTNNASIQIDGLKSTNLEDGKEGTCVIDNVKESEMDENVELGELEGSNKDDGDAGINEAANLELEKEEDNEEDSGFKLDGTTDFDVEAERLEMEQTGDDLDDTIDDEITMDTEEMVSDADDFIKLKQNSDADDGDISVKSEDATEDESISRMIQDRVSECLNFQVKVTNDLNSSKVMPTRSKVPKRKGAQHLVDEDPDYEVPTKRGRRKKFASKKNAGKRRIAVVTDSTTESGVESAVVKVEVDNKSLDAGDNMDESVDLTAEKDMDGPSKNENNEDVFNEFMQTQEDDDEDEDGADGEDESPGSSSSKKGKKRTSSGSPSKGRHHECEICHKVYTQKYRLRQHMNMHLGIKPHKCVVCSQMFSRTDHVIRHMRSQHCNMNEFECDVCNEKFEKPNEMVAHYLNHNVGDVENDRPKLVFTDEEKKYISIETLESGKMQYDCKMCEKTFKKPYQAREHVNYHTGERPYHCEQCDATYAKRDNLSTHIRMVHNGIRGEYQCTDCRRYFFKKENYETHVEKCTPSHKCDKCPMLFYRKTHLDNHLPVHESTPQVQCQHCDSKFKYRKHLLRHVKKEHSEMKPESLPIECICDQCGVVVKSKEALYRHKKVHKVPDKECDVCGKAFKDNTTLKDHKLMHSNIRDYQCEICSMLFSRKGNLVRHQKRHRGERKYRCDVCGMCFVANCDLTRHKNTHLGVKKFPCRYCGRKFGLRSKVTVHERTHTGERPYFCREENCGKTFKQTGDRVRHEKKVHNLVFNKYMTLYELATGETEDIYKRTAREGNNENSEEMSMSAMDTEPGEPGETVPIQTHPSLANPVDLNAVYCPPLDISVPTSTATVNVPIGDTTTTGIRAYTAVLTNPAASNAVLKNDSQDVLNAALQLATASAIQSVSNMAPTDLSLVAQAAQAAQAAQSGTPLEGGGGGNIEDIEMSRMFQRTVAQFSSQMM